MKLLILMLMVGATAILVFQNLTPVPLYFFGSKIALELPVTAWILLFTAAGFFTSLFWQFLQYLQRQSNRKTIYVKEPQPDFSKSPPKEAPQERVSVSSTAPKNNPKENESPRYSNAAAAESSEWETNSKKDEEEDDWNIEESPSEPTPIRNFDRTIAEKEYTRNFEVQQEPKTAFRSGSVYSYKYRQSDEAKETNQTDKIYDANYRVVRPPYRQNPEQQTEEEDEDWI